MSGSSSHSASWIPWRPAGKRPYPPWMWTGPGLSGQRPRKKPSSPWPPGHHAGLPPGWGCAPTSPPHVPRGEGTDQLLGEVRLYPKQRRDTGGPLICPLARI